MSQTEAVMSEHPPCGLTWGIKASFLSYLKRLPDREVYLGEGATLIDGRFHFPLASDSDYDVAADAGTLKFSGDVRFVGHFGMLYVTFVDPWLEMDGRRGALTIADPDFHPDATRRLPMVELSIAAPAEVAGPREWTGISTALRPEATHLFSDTYAPGESFDPLDVVVALASAP